MIDIKNKVDCCGCESCVNVCPKNCIKMKSDNEGFAYPDVNKSMCINCGLCNKSCPVLNNQAGTHSVKVYGCYNKNQDVRMSSSSGGIFHLLCEYIISRNGVVFGAAFDENFNVYHDYAETMEECERFKGSKYVQSVIGDSFCIAKEFLDSGKLVLFSGTPCQIAGLRTFLRKDYDNLYTQDIACHSVPSPKVWNEYKTSVCAGRKIKDLQFRSKETGWNRSTMKIIFDNDEVVSGLYSENAFIKGFINGLYSRPSCYDCKFTADKRKSDITLGDFWGADAFYPQFNDNKGISVVFVNSPKGEKLFAYAKKNIYLKKATAEKAVWYNPALVSSAKENPNRENFFKSADKAFDGRVIENYYKFSSDSKDYVPSMAEKVKFKLYNFFSRSQ